MGDTGHKFSVGVIDTAEQLIAGVVDTGDQHSFAIISANFRKNSKWPQWYTWGPGDTDSWKKPEVENFMSDSFKLFFIWKKGVES